MAALLLAVVLALPALADQASSAYKKGHEAEARQDWEQAYELYKKAYDLKPANLRYRSAYERAKFQAAASHIHRGQLLRDGGNLDQALVEFERAALIDASLDVAKQEIKRTKEMIEKSQSGQPQASPINISALGRIAAESEGPAELKPIASTPITMKMTEDSKVVYAAVGKLAGINVLFDPDYTSRRISIELNNVSLYQALEIVALESKTFWRPVTPNTIFIAADQKTKRTEFEQNVVKTFYMSNLSQTTEFQDIVNALRTVVDVQRVLPLPSQSAIIMRGTPDQVALAEKLINDIDKAKPEVIVDIAIMQVQRNKMRTLGINPPTSGTVQLQSNLTNTSSSTSSTSTTTTTTTTPTTSTTPSLTLNNLANLTSNNFAVTIPAATATALMSDADTKIIQNPQIRALDGQKASLKIGERVPVATGSFQPGIGGVGINPLVNTQFQYIDVGVNIDVQPNVHAGREVTLKVTMEVSAVDSQTNIGGISQPVIGQRKVDHTIRLKEGEVNLMGGMLEQQDVKSLSGFPWISSVPILKYLFSQENVTHVDNEIVFMMVPHIVRGPEISELNLKPLDVGTANAIELRRGSPPPAPAPTGARNAQPTTAPASAKAAMMAAVQETQTPPAPANVSVAANAPPASGAAPATQTNVPAQANVGTAPAPANPPATGNMGAAGATAAAVSAPANAIAPANIPATPAAFSFDPAATQQSPGATFAVNVVVTGAQNVYSVPVQINYDPKLLQLVNVSNGNFLSRDGQAVALVHREDAEAGTVQVSATRPPGAGGASGQGTVFTLTFMAKAAGEVMISMPRASVRDPNMQAMQVTTSPAVVKIK